MGTTWKPDTCGCEIEYDPHPDDPHTKIVHRRSNRACPKHEHLAHTQAHADEVLRHNQQKNVVVNHLSNKLGRPVYGFYSPVAPSDNDPVVVINHGFSGDELTNLQTHVDDQFGAGRVIISEVALSEVG